jgi:hypothetical protein
VLSVGSQTFLKPSRLTLASVEVPQGSQALVTDAGVIEALGPDVTVRVDAPASAKTLVAVGRDSDVSAWLGKGAAYRVTGFASANSLEASSTGAGKIPANVYSDLWLTSEVVTGSGSFEWKDIPGRWSLIVLPITAGAAGATSTSLTGHALDVTQMSLEWPTAGNSFVFYASLIAGNVLILLALGLLWSVWAPRVAGLGRLFTRSGASLTSRAQTRAQKAQPEVADGPQLEASPAEGAQPSLAPMSPTEELTREEASAPATEPEKQIPAGSPTKAEEAVEPLHEAEREEPQDSAFRGITPEQRDIIEAIKRGEVPAGLTRHEVRELLALDAATPKASGAASSVEPVSPSPEPEAEEPEADSTVHPLSPSERLGSHPAPEDPQSTQEPSPEHESAEQASPSPKPKARLTRQEKRAARASRKAAKKAEGAPLATVEETPEEPKRPPESMTGAKWRSVWDNGSAGWPASPEEGASSEASSSTGQSFPALPKQGDESHEA